MIANLFFSLIAAGFAAEAAAKARYERLWSFLLLGILALLGFNFWENGQLGVVETFAFFIPTQPFTAWLLLSSC